MDLLAGATCCSEHYLCCSVSMDDADCDFQWNILGLLEDAWKCRYLTNDLLTYVEPFNKKIFKQLQK